MHVSAVTEIFLFFLQTVYPVPGSYFSQNYRKSSKYLVGRRVRIDEPPLTSRFVLARQATSEYSSLCAY